MITTAGNRLIIPEPQAALDSNYAQSCLYANKSSVISYYSRVTQIETLQKGRSAPLNYHKSSIENFTSVSQSNIQNTCHYSHK